MTVEVYIDGIDARGFYYDVSDAAVPLHRERDLGSAGRLLETARRFAGSLAAYRGDPLGGVPEARFQTRFAAQEYYSAVRAFANQVADAARAIADDARPTWGTGVDVRASLDQPNGGGDVVFTMAEPRRRQQEDKTLLPLPPQMEERAMVIRAALEARAQEDVAGRVARSAGVRPGRGYDSRAEARRSLFVTDVGRLLTGRGGQIGRHRGRR